MKKSFMSNIKNFVDSNVLHRNEKGSLQNSDLFEDDLTIRLIERQFDENRRFLVEAEKRISNLLQSIVLNSNNTDVNIVINGNSSLDNEQQQLVLSKQQQQQQQQQQNEVQQQQQTENYLATQFSSIVNKTCQLDDDNLKRLKKLPQVGFLKFLNKSKDSLKSDSLLSSALAHCSSIQANLTSLYLKHEKLIESECLKPIQLMLENDVPNVIKLRKLFIKSHNDLEAIKTKYNCASLKQSQLQQQLQLNQHHHNQQPNQQAHHFTSASYTINQNGSQQQSNVHKLDHLKKELDEAIIRYEQAKDAYATDLCAFICREPELVNILVKFYQYQGEYQQQIASSIKNSMPVLDELRSTTPRRVVFGTPLDEHLRCIGRPVSLVIEMCIHILSLNALEEEGLFRVPGSSVKIKRLKHSIDAWFVALPGLGETENDRLPLQNQADMARDHSSMVAIYNLFKDIACHGQQTAWLQALNNQQGSTRASNNTSYYSSHCSHKPDNVNNTTSTNVNETTPSYDVHTVAGLLKLYLRELPEPLFTFDLYQQWIDAVVINLNKSEQDDAGSQPLIDSLRKLVNLLPDTNQKNLAYLIRFLHLLTCHKQLNKMTATNLSITMAPSLIWPPPDGQIKKGSCLVNSNQADSENPHNEMELLNMQMNSIGLSTSLNALVIEKLIKHADSLFPDPINFKIPALEVNQTLTNVKESYRLSKKIVKSISPTGLSTASSSSFSSASSSRTSGRRWVEGMQGDEEIPRMSPVDDGSAKQVKPPPVPPLPKARLSMQAQNLVNTIPRAHPRNFSATVETTKEISKIDDDQISINKFACSDATSTPVVPTSLRGTGTLPLKTKTSSTSRPCVPPPELPAAGISGTRDDEMRDSPKNSSLSSTRLGSDFVEINNSDIDMICAGEKNNMSPVISIDTLSSEETSFDENSASTGGNSWSECAGNLINEKPQDCDRLEISIDEQAETRVYKNSVPSNDAKPDESQTKHNRPSRPPRNFSPRSPQSTIL